jgi:hypothetical protein
VKEFLSRTVSVSSLALDTASKKVRDTASRKVRDTASRKVRAVAQLEPQGLSAMIKVYRLWWETPVLLVTPSSLFD